MAIRYSGPVPLIDAAGQLRKLACLLPTPQQLGAATKYGAVFTDPINRTTWKDYDVANLIKLIIRNQGQHGSCTGHAGVTAEDIQRRLEGQDEISLSCTFPYAQVNNNQDNGASVSSILEVLMQLGTCTFQECPTDSIYKQNIPESAYETAQKYKVQTAYLCQSYDQLIDAINRGFSVAFGIQIGNNFSRLSPDGVAPLPMMVIGGHALCGIGIKFDGSDWLLKVQNSWGPQWGMQGCCYLTRRHFAHIVDGYAVQYVENIQPPPIAKVEVAVTGKPALVKPEPPPLPPGAEFEPVEHKAEPVLVGEQPSSTSTTPLEPVPVQPEESLLAQFDDEPEGTASDTHVDPESLMGKGKKGRHQH